MTFGTAPVHGASDTTDSEPVCPDDLAATVFAALGIDPHTKLRTVDGRPVPAACGKPITALFA